MTQPRPSTLLSEADAVRLLRAADPAPTTGRAGHALDRRARDDLAALLAQPQAPPGTEVPSAWATDPGRRRWLRPAAYAAIPAAASAVVAVALVLSAGQPHGDELASWSPVPETAPGADVSDHDIQSWASKCHDLTGATVGLEGVPPHAQQAAGRDVLVDRRGIYTFCVDVYSGTGAADDPSVALSGIRGGDVQQVGGTVYDQPFPASAADGVLVLGGDSTTVTPVDEDGQPLTDPNQVHVLYGLAGPQVTGVDVVLANGLRVTATLQHGTWGVWWPARKGDPVGALLTTHTTTGEHSVDPATAGLDWTQ